MANVLPDKFPQHGWESRFDVETARTLLPSVDELVPHPRYGKGPALHGEKFSDAAAFGIYQFLPAWTFPNTKIWADVSKQNYSVVARSEYVDVLCRCRECRRWFIFFAKEQQYWFEELRFFIDSRCVHCPECRHIRRQHHREEQEFASLQTVVQPTPDQITRLLELTIALWNRRFIQKRHQLDLVIRQVILHRQDNVLLNVVRELRSQFDAT